MDNTELNSQLKELSINLKWANTLVEQLKKSVSSHDNETLHDFLKLTDKANDSVSHFCTSVDNVLNKPENDDEDEEYDDKSNVLLSPPPKENNDDFTPSEENNDDDTPPKGDNEDDSDTDASESMMDDFAATPTTASQILPNPQISHRTEMELFSKGFTNSASDILTALEEDLAVHEVIISEEAEFQQSMNTDKSYVENDVKNGKLNDVDMFDDLDDADFNNTLAGVDLDNLGHKSVAKEDVEENLDDCTPPEKKHIDILKQYFGFSKFRPMQWKVIQSVLDEKRDNCVVMATGAGKSLCYQYPAVFTNGVVVVVSPLISLMEDQVQALNIANIDACFLGSAQSNSTDVRNGIFQGKYRLVYVTPEYITTTESFLTELDKKVGITLVAIDEAHCVSQWGHDFRSSYRGLNIVRNLLPKVPIMALTATATPIVRTDICNNLQLRNAIIRCTGFDRKNLFLAVRNKSSILNDLLPLMTKESKNGRTKYSFNGTTIIYCPTKKKTEEVAQVLMSYSVACEPYHAGLSITRRRNTHYKFIRDELDCIVATIAFGMGIDKPDIRLVVHYGAPKDIESYYQEIGRAGRDGQPSICCTFYNNADFALSRHFLAEIRDPKFKLYKNGMMVKMEQYLMTSGCRRKAILSHFDDNVSNIGGHKECCDNCRQSLLNPKSFISTCLKSGEPMNFGKDIKLLLRAIKLTGDGMYGMTIPVLLLRGSSSQKLPERFSKVMEYGAGRSKSEKYWKALGRQIMGEGYLTETPVPSGYGSTVCTTDKATKWLQESLDIEEPEFILKQPNTDLLTEIKARLPPDKADPQARIAMIMNILPEKPIDKPWVENIGMLHNILTQIPQTSSASTDLTNNALEGELNTRLLQVRQMLARKLDIPPYMVATNKNIQDMAKIRPSSVVSFLLMIDGISENLCRRFGHAFLEEIRIFCAEKSLAMDASARNDVHSSPISTDDNSPRSLTRGDGYKSELNATQLESYRLHKSNCSIDDIAKKRSFVEDTIYGHLATALKCGHSVDYCRLGITEDEVSKVVQVVRSKEIKSDVRRLRPIKDMLPVTVGFGKLRFILTMLEITYGATEDPTPNVPTQVSNFKTKYSYKKKTSTSAKKTFFASSQGTTASYSGKRKVPDWMSTGSSTSYKRTSSKTKKLF